MRSFAAVRRFAIPLVGVALIIFFAAQVRAARDRPGAPAVAPAGAGVVFVRLRAVETCATVAPTRTSARIG